MIGLENAQGVVAIAVLYGYFAGMCRFRLIMNVTWLNPCIKLLRSLPHFWPYWQMISQSWGKHQLFNRKYIFIYTLVLEWALLLR